MAGFCASGAAAVAGGSGGHAAIHHHASHGLYCVQTSQPSRALRRRVSSTPGTVDNQEGHYYVKIRWLQLEHALHSACPDTGRSTVLAHIPLGLRDEPASAAGSHDFKALPMYIVFASAETYQS